MHTYGSWEVFFSAAPTAQNSPELHFRFIDSPIQSSVLKPVFEINPPKLFTGLGHRCIDGAIYPHRHHAIEHFRRKFVYHWNLISTPRQVHPCPHSQKGFDSWEKLHQHVLSEYNSYGQFYDEPDYLGES